MNETHIQIWLAALNSALAGASSILGQKSDTIAKRAALVADAAVDQYRMRFELPPAQVPASDAETE